MVTKDPTQKSKLLLQAIELSISSEESKELYVRPVLQKCLTMEEIAAEVAVLSSRNEDASEVTRTGNLIFERMMWYLSSGYSVSTKMGSFRLTIKGTLQESELSSAPNPEKLTFGIAYTMSKEMRDELSDVAGGGCHQKDGRLVVTVGTQKDCFVCKNCGKTAEDNFIPEGIMAITGNSHHCKGTNAISNCGNCKFISHEKGLWLCNNPINIK